MPALKGNERGFSIAEIVVAIGLFSIISLGVIAVMSEMSKQSQIGEFRSLLTNQKLQIEELVRNPNAWQQTVQAASNNAATNITCLRATPVPATGCASGTTQTDNFDLVDRSGASFIDTTPTTNGFTVKGRPCATFGTSTDCVLRWSLSIAHVCMSGAGTSCFSPTTRFQAVPILSPLASTDLRFNSDLYKVDITLQASSRFEPIVYVERLSGVGAGRCGPNPGIRRATRMINTKIQDPGNNVALPGGGVMRFNKGRYQCRIVAPAFKVGVHYLTFEESGGGGAILATSAPSISPRRYSVITNVVLETAFTVPTGSRDYIVRHNCEYNTYPNPTFPLEATNLSLQLGFSTAASYATTQVDYATVSCYRND